MALSRHLIKQIPERGRHGTVGEFAAAGDGAQPSKRSGSGGAADQAKARVPDKWGASSAHGSGKGPRTTLAARGGG